MMLPSGNDAAIAISEVIGLLSFLKSKNKNVDPYAPDWYRPYTNKNYSYIFIGMMNERCQKIGTLDTKFFNSHGNDSYDQLKNISTCNEIARISSEFMNYPKLKDIVKTTNYGPY
jgi:D-alanyl-D-alanine carboxypeptidase